MTVPPTSSGRLPTDRKIPFWPLLLIGLVLGFALFGDRGILRLYQYERQKYELNREIGLVSGQNQLLRKEIEALRSDDKYIEGIARKELGMVRDDELVYQFPTSTRHATEPVRSRDHE